VVQDLPTIYFGKLELEEGNKASHPLVLYTPTHENSIRGRREEHTCEMLLAGSSIVRLSKRKMTVVSKGSCTQDKKTLLFPPMVDLSANLLKVDRKLNPTTEY
jgi:hypothetical protein